MSARTRTSHVAVAVAVLAVVFLWALIAHRLPTREAALLTEGLIIAGATLAALAVVRPGRAALLPFVLTLFLTLAVYAVPPGPIGHDHFDSHLFATIVVAAVVAALAAVQARTVWDAAARALVCVFGAALPPLLAFGFLIAACHGGRCG